MTPKEFLSKAQAEINKHIDKHGALLILPASIPDTMKCELPLSEIEKLGCKLAATGLLQSGGNDRKLVLVSRQEWIGLNLLDPDGELP